MILFIYFKAQNQCNANEIFIKVCLMSIFHSSTQARGNTVRQLLYTSIAQKQSPNHPLLEISRWCEKRKEGQGQVKLPSKEEGDLRAFVLLSRGV